MPKCAGVDISVWIGIYCIGNRSWLIKCCYKTLLQFFLHMKNKLANGALWHSTQTLPRHSLHSECHMVLQYICKWGFIYAIRKWWPSPCANFHYTLKYLTLFCTYLLYWTSSKIRQWMYKVWIEIYFHFYIKHGFHCANYYEGCTCSVNLCGCFLYWGISKLDDECRKYRDLSVIKSLSIFIKFIIVLYKKLSSKREFYK